MNILIIDDSLTTRSFISKALQSVNYITEQAVNGKDGLKKLTEFKADVIVLDLLMPVMDGFEFLKKCNSNGIKIPIIVLTADIQSEVKEECLNLGASAFLNKPFNQSELLNTVEKIK